MAKKQQKPALIEPREDLVRAAKQAAVGIKQRAPEADRNRRVPVENIRELHEAGLLTVAIPADLGGCEVDLVTQIALYEIIGGACGLTEPRDRSISVPWRSVRRSWNRSIPMSRRA